ncbi:Scr1 family TA system antitoxin-like transcriptional regulator, partial [Streptomyces sp. SID13588]|uniref:Scr1 family TA system antitoxin-like transcriptional regulator n=1 Tax=Streptomyces sp. SID13588 TaxID=2706051 RepID=UPI0031BA1838
MCTGHASDAAAKPAPADATTNAEATTPTCGCSTKRASSYETLFIPGLLQTEGYMRAILGSAQRPDIEPA